HRDRAAYVARHPVPVLRRGDRGDRRSRPARTRHRPRRPGRLSHPHAVERQPGRWFHHRRSVAADPRSLLTFYRDLIHLRRETAVLRAGDYQPCAADPYVYAYHRHDPTDDVL